MILKNRPFSYEFWKIIYYLLIGPTICLLSFISADISIGYSVNEILKDVGSDDLLSISVLTFLVFLIFESIPLLAYLLSRFKFIAKRMKTIIFAFDCSFLLIILITFYTYFTAWEKTSSTGVIGIVYIHKYTLMAFPFLMVASYFILNVYSIIRRRLKTNPVVKGGLNVKKPW